MLLRRTERARIELLPGPRGLSLRERTLLLLCDGKKSLMDLRSMFDGEGEQLVLDLVRQGYLEPVTGGLPAAGGRPPPAASRRPAP